jgi:hypothetical protein
LRVEGGEVGVSVGVGTVESCFVEVIDSISLIDAIVIIFCGVADHPDLVLLVDEVAVRYM